jgi:hypothetical protein
MPCEEVPHLPCYGIRRKCFEGALEKDLTHFGTHHIHLHDLKL